MSRSENTRQLMLLMSGMFVVGIAMIVAVFVATRRPVVMVMPGQTGAGSQPMETLPAPGTDSGAGQSGAEQLPIPEIQVVRVPSAPSTDDPLDAAWNQIVSVEIPLEPQKTAAPMLDTSTIASLRAQAARDDQRIVWRLSWAQPEPNDQSNVAEFADAVAIQFPMKDGAPFTMGGPEMPVTMLYWKALWQRDVDQGFQDVTAQYPNAWSDFYWFANGQPPFPLGESFSDPVSHQWLIGISAGNPMADMHRSQPLEELTAHGFGSSTTVADSPSTARGVWNNGQWTVVIDRPWNPGDRLIERFNANPAQQLIALAVWDGSGQNRGGRKHITNWLPMRIEP